MARILGYIGASLDGFIADRNEKLEWLYRHGGVDYGEFSHERFMESIGTVVMGRATYEWLRREVKEWVHPDQDTIVVTSRPLPRTPHRVRAWGDSLDALVAHLRAMKGRDAWIVGGGKLQSALVARGAIDHLQVFLMPVLIGGGSPLWTGIEGEVPLALEDARHIQGGVVRLAYSPKR